MSANSLVTAVLMANAMFDYGATVPIPSQRIDFHQFSDGGDHQRKGHRYQDPFPPSRNPKLKGAGNYRQNYGHQRYSQRSQDGHLYRHR